ncbi:MAG: hypothetical protein K5773_06330 [Pseudobutyrivibrio sp.]|nr:hypothetical protein [Pseudobutyrivibrio sp.]
MNAFINFRDGIRQFVLAREMVFIKIWHGLVALVGLLAISHNFGYNKTISPLPITLLVSLACAFFPMDGVALVLSAFLLIDLGSLSTEAAIVAFALLLVGYMICAYFRSKNTYNMVAVPICYSFNAPYVMAMANALMGSLNEICSVIMGTITAYYLHIIKNNAAAILDETSDVSVVALIKEQIIGGKMFYFFMAAMIAMFLIVYFVRTASIHMSWLVADVVGVLAEFIIMLSGFIITSQRGEIPGLILGNVLVLLVGFVLNYFIMDLDYSRIEKVQFEDDDYYYYVTAVPKIRIVKEDKEVKTF